MRSNTAEVTSSQIEARRSRANIARVAVVPVVAAIALAACTPGEHAPSAPNTLQSTSHTTAATASVAPSAEATSRATQPTPSPSVANPRKTSGLAGCEPYFDFSKYQNHEYEVCVAYISNAAEVALQGLYKFGNNRVSYLSDAARHHFETRYWEQPRQAIEQEVDSWPKIDNVAGNKVEESITLLSLTSNLQADRGLLQTQENWQVTSPDGTALYSEPAHTKDITMCRGKLPGHPLHEWMVVSNSRMPNFDCIGFDESHGIAP